MVKQQARLILFGINYINRGASFKCDVDAFLLQAGANNAPMLETSEEEFDSEEE